MDRPAVIILNYNSYDCCERLISSIEKYDPGSFIILVDNASSGKERQRLLLLSGRCELLLLSGNGGYAAGVNAGIRRAVKMGYDTFLLANSDTYLISRHTISRCYEYMKHNGIGILAPRLVNANGEDISGYVTDDRYGRTRRHLTGEITECRSVVGAFIFIDKTVTDAVGFIREFYFLYREDTDFCIRACNRGFKTVFYPMVTVVHTGQATTKKVAEYYYNRNTFILARQIHKTGTLRLAVYWFFRYILLALKIIKSSGSGREARIRLHHVLHAYVDGVRDIRGRMKG